MRRNAIMGLAAGYDRDKLEPFLISIRKAMPSVDVVLFTANLNAAALEFLDSNRVTTVAIEISAYSDFSWYWRRWFFYRDYLRKNSSRYERIFISDVRDVVFQSCPFDNAASPSEAYMEGEAIENCKLNKRWVLEAGGIEALGEIGHNQICCAGTLMLSGNDIDRFLTEMCATLEGYSQPFVSDQGVFNILIQRQLRNVIIPRSNGETVVNLNSYLKRRDFTIDAQNRICMHGKPVPVLHQYDRKPEVIEAVRRQLGLSRMPEFKPPRPLWRSLTKPLREPFKRLFK